MSSSTKTGEARVREMGRGDNPRLVVLSKRVHGPSRSISSSSAGCYTGGGRRRPTLDLDRAEFDVWHPCGGGGAKILFGGN